MAIYAALRHVAMTIPVWIFVVTSVKVVLMIVVIALWSAVVNLVGYKIDIMVAKSNILINIFLRNAQNR